MTLASPSRDSTRYKRCPTCRRVTPADSQRCYECWNDVANTAVLSPEEGIRAIARQTASDLADQALVTRRRAFWRRARKVAIAFGAGVMSVVIYFTFIYAPDPPRPGRDPSINMTVAEALWPIDGHDLGGSRASSSRPAIAAPIAWSTALGSPPRVPLVAGETLVYTALEDGRVVAIEQATGREAWAHALANPPIAAPTLASGRLFVPQVSGRLLVLDAESGAVVFETPVLPTSFTTSPMVADGVVYLFGTGALVALDASTGAPLWRHAVPGTWAFVTPVLAGRHIAVATGDRTLIFDRLTGQQTYFYEFRRAHPYSITLVDDTVYSVSSRFAAAIDVTSERPWWERWRKYWNQFWVWGMAPEPPPPPSLWVTSRPPRDGYPVAVAPDRLLVAGPTGDLRAISRADGAPLWQQQVAPIMAPPTLTGAGILVLHENALSLYAADNGALLSTRPIEVSTPLEHVVATSKGTYVVTQDGQLTALR